MPKRKTSHDKDELFAVAHACLELQMIRVLLRENKEAERALRKVQLRLHPEKTELSEVVLLLLDALKDGGEPNIGDSLDSRFLMPIKKWW